LGYGPPHLKKTFVFVEARSILHAPKVSVLIIV
jgi:hypothetical protein